MQTRGQPRERIENALALLTPTLFADRPQVANCRRLDVARLEEILRRQDPPAWGAAYEPAIKATREEAPAKSRPSHVWCGLLQRNIAALSLAERSVLLIVLYCPWLFELQEQRMLPYILAQHPLSGHPRAAGMSLPKMRGTLTVAEEMGLLKWHPTITAREGRGDDEGPEPGCWIGDFLLFLNDRHGPFCTNLSVKATRDEFVRPQVRITPRTNLQRAKQKEAARHEIEKVMYAEVGIPTFHVAADEIDPIIVAKLEQVFLWQKRTHHLSHGQVQRVLSVLDTALDKELPALEVLRLVEASHRVPLYESKILMYQAIWSRRLRINLFEHFFIEQPLMPETRDVLEVYGEWFQRSTG